MFTAV